MEAQEIDATYEQLAQTNNELLDERNEALDEVARLRKELELRQSHEEMNLAMLRKAREERDAMALRVETVRPMIEAYRSHLGGDIESLDDEEYVDAVLADDWLDTNTSVSLARRDALKQAEALEKC